MGPIGRIGLMLAHLSYRSRRSHVSYRSPPKSDTILPSKNKQQEATMKLKVCLGVTLVSLFAFSAVADHHAKADHQEKNAAAPMDPAMMEAMVKAATPGEAHKKLDGMVGTWNTEIKMWMMPGSDPMTSSGTAENRWVLGGRYVEQ